MTGSCIAKGENDSFHLIERHARKEQQRKPFRFLFYPLPDSSRWPNELGDCGECEKYQPGKAAASLRFQNRPEKLQAE